MKFSTYYPSILAICDEDGYIILLDSNSKIIKDINNKINENNNIINIKNTNKNINKRNI